MASFANLHEISYRDQNIYKDLTQNLKYISFLLFPNLVNINQLCEINEDFIEENLDFFRLVIIPVYKHYWKFGYLKIVKKTVNNVIKRYLYLNDEINNGVMFDPIYITCKITSYNKPSKSLLVLIDNLEYHLTYSAYSFLVLAGKISLKDLTFFEVLGVVSSAMRYGFISIGKNYNGLFTFRKNFINPFDSTKRQFQKISLKSIEPINQLKMFDIWMNRKNCVVTGSTGVGKTSQVPKVFYWYNFLFGGYDIRKNFIDLELDYDNKDKTMVVFPRKALIVSNGENFLKSIGYYKAGSIVFKESPVTMNFKDVSETLYYNNKCKTTELNLCINRIAASSKLSSDRFSSIFVDEIHEHETFSDICISILRNKKKKYGINNIILMSATIDEDKERIKEYFHNDVEFIHIEGDRLFPVKEIYIGEKFLIQEVVSRHKPDRGKAGIFFFPRISDVEDNYKLLTDVFKNDTNFLFVRVHSKVKPSPSDVINMIENSFNQHVIVLSTNILESSLTITNAQYVYDTGTFFCKKFYSGKVENITNSMAEQRKGRVGRKFPGCYVILYDREKLNKNMKKINNEFLYPYIIFFKMMNIKFEDMFILPDDINRFNRSIEYLEQNGIVVKTNIKNIFKIYNRYPCNMIEYIPLYLKNYIKKELSELEEMHINDEKISFILSNKNLLEELKNMNVTCSYVMSKKCYGNDFISNIKVSIKSKYFDGIKDIIGQTISTKTDSIYYMVSLNLFLPYSI